LRRLDIFVKGEYKHGKVIYPNNTNYELRDHESYLSCAKNVVEGKEIDTLGSNSYLKSASKGIFGPVSINKFVKFPDAFPLESMHGLDLGLFKNFNHLFFYQANKNKPYYKGSF
jgi:hypothetical protein